MAKSRRNNLRKGGTLCASRIRGRFRIYLHFRVASTREVAELVNDSTLLRYDQQQPES